MDSSSWRDSARGDASHRRIQTATTGTGTMRRAGRGEVKAGPKSGGKREHGSMADGSNVFRNYMHRKIELQRRQFGLVLPPDPAVVAAKRREEAEAAAAAAAAAAEMKKVAVGRASIAPQTFGDDIASSGGRKCDRADCDGAVLGTASARRSRRDGGDDNDDKSSGEGATFSSDPVLEVDAFSTTSKKSNTPAEVAGGMAEVLQRLKRRHGGHSSGARRGRKRGRSSASSSSSSAAAAAGSLEARSLVVNDVIVVEDGLRDADSIRTVPAGRNDASVGRAAAANHDGDENDKDNDKDDRKDSLCKTSVRRSDLFLSGVVVLINGYTDPDASTLQRLLHRHGGDVEKYETSRVTHIIASALSHAKVLIYRRKRCPIPVVRPEWIVDMVRVSRKLSHDTYILKELRIDGIEGVDGMGAKTKTVGDYFVASTRPGPGPGVQCPPLGDGESITPYGGKGSNSSLCGVIREGGGGQGQIENGGFRKMNANLLDEVLDRDDQNNSKNSSSDAFRDDVGKYSGVMEDGPEITHIEAQEGQINGIPLARVIAIPEGGKEDVKNNYNEPKKLQFKKNDCAGGGSLSLDDKRTEQGLLIEGAPISNDGSEFLEARSAVVEKEERGTCFERESHKEFDENRIGPVQKESSLILVDYEAHQHTADSIPARKTAIDGIMPKVREASNQMTELRRIPYPSKPLPNASFEVRTVGTDPNFLQSYFNNSRLSFIGSFKQRVQPPPVDSSSSTSAVPSRRGSHRFVLHVDMDCFFAAVVLRNYPQYKDKPVAIGHAWRNNPGGASKAVGGESAAASTGWGRREKKSYSELSTVNYEARKYGLKKGMFLHQARQLCPNLIVLPYDYEGYEDVSYRVAEILHRRAEELGGCVEQVSCDESYLEVFLDVPPDDKSRAGSSVEDMCQEVAESIRADIRASTQCTASVGVGPNKFLSKLATDKAKPNGSYVVTEWRRLLGDMNLRDMPGIGWKLERKLREENLVVVRDIWDLGDEARGVLGSVLGEGNGAKLLNYCEGKDDRPIQPAPRKSIGAECNYGVRFDGPYGVDYMVKGLADEVEKRMRLVGVRGKHITLKVMKRKDGAGNPAKFLGHGPCYHLSKSCELHHVPTNEGSIIFKAGMKLFEEIAVDKDDVRGMGIVVSKLDVNMTDSKVNSEAQDMSAWLRGFQGDNNSREFGKSDAARNDKVNGLHGYHSSHQISRPNIMLESRNASLQSHGKRSCVVSTDQSTENDRTHSDNLCTAKRSIREQLEESLSIETRGGGSKTSQTSVTVQDLVGRTPTCSPNARIAPVICKDLSTCHRNDQDETIEVLGDTSDSSQEESNIEILEDEVALPPLSEIDLNEVMALPSQLRTQILKKLDLPKEDALGASVSSLTPPGPVPERTANPSRTKLESKDRTNRVRSRRRRKIRTGPGQLSMKKMLKLASVKSGCEELRDQFGGDAVSLTQLECLPLKIQLQVANNDEIDARTPIIKNQRKFGKESSRHPENGRTELAAESLTSNAGRSADISLNEVVDFQIERDTSFYEQNIKPLWDWMQNCPEPTIGDVSKLQTFFFKCLSERRLDEVVKMLRLVRRGPGEWRGGPYAATLSAVESHLKATRRMVLDVKWLGLACIAPEKNSIRF